MLLVLLVRWRDLGPKVRRLISCRYSKCWIARAVMAIRGVRVGLWISPFGISSTMA
jgi:hypothetical protein